MDPLKKKTSFSDDHRPIFDRFTTKRRNSSRTEHWTTVSLVPWFSWILTVPKTRISRLKTDGDWKMLHCLLKWSLSKGHSFIFDGGNNPWKLTWIPKMMGLGKGNSFKIRHFLRYRHVKFLNIFLGCGYSMCRPNLQVIEYHWPSKLGVPDLAGKHWMTLFSNYK